MNKYDVQCISLFVDETDMDETMRLERKRQQLQRELSKLEAEDDSDRPTGPDKPVNSFLQSTFVLQIQKSYFLLQRQNHVHCGITRSFGHSVMFKCPVVNIMS